MTRNGLIRGAENAWSFNYCKGSDGEEEEDPKCRGGQKQRWKEKRNPMSRDRDGDLDSSRPIAVNHHEQR
jgi:hypothetical protein